MRINLDSSSFENHHNKLENENVLKRQHFRFDKFVQANAQNRQKCAINVQKCEKFLNKKSSQTHEFASLRVYIYSSSS